MMQVVILAAGRGERFVKAGYHVPKPLIESRGKALITYAMEQAVAVGGYRAGGGPIVLCPEPLRFDVWRLAPQGVIPTTVGIRYVQSGAAMSLLTAGSALNEDWPVVVMDCDSIVDMEALCNFVKWSEGLFSSGFQSSVLCFRVPDGEEKYSFVRGDGIRLLAVAEKQKISDVATTGVHCFVSWKLLRSAICAMVEKDDVTNDEYYLAPVHNYIQHAAFYTLPDGKFTPLGTPEQLKAHEEGSLGKE